MNTHLHPSIPAILGQNPSQNPIDFDSRTGRLDPSGMEARNEWLVAGTCPVRVVDLLIEQIIFCERWGHSITTTIFGGITLLIGSQCSKHVNSHGG